VSDYTDSELIANLLHVGRGGGNKTVGPSLRALVKCAAVRVTEKNDALEMMRRDHAAELARVEGERDSIRNAVAEACMWSGCNSAKELREALERNYKRATNAEKENALLRAECEAWRKWFDAESSIELDEPLLYQAAVNARAATDAAGILKGGDS